MFDDGNNCTEISSFFQSAISFRATIQANKFVRKFPSK